MRALLGFLLLIALLTGGGYLVARYFKPPAVEIPVVGVRRGEFLVKTRARGDLRAVKSTLVNAPSIGGSLSIVSLKAMGEPVKEGDVVLAFDPADQQNALDTSRSRLEEAQQSLRKIEADQAIARHTDQVELLKAEFAVRRAELDVSRNELVSQIDAQKNLLALEAARKRLAQLQEDIRSRQKSGEAERAVAQEKVNKADLDVKQARTRLDQITVKAAMTGLVNVRQNRFASGGFFTTGMEIPEYRVGDQTFSGDTVMEVVDTAALEVGGRIGEADRANLKEGQEVQIRPDALPGVTLAGQVKSAAGMTSRSFFSNDPNKTFDVVFSLKQQDSRLRPGMSVEVDIITERVREAVFVPSQAIFDKEGKKWVFVKSGGGFDRREVTLGRKSESQVEITKGLQGGEQLALVDIESRDNVARKTKNPLAAGPGGK
jgi:multidrug resistance efflux pump